MVSHMRFIAQAIVVFCFFIPQKTNAMTNGGLYEFCKPFADSGFKASSSEDLMCVGYVMGVGETADLAYCHIKTSFGFPFNSSSFNAVVQDYVNRMKSEPNLWTNTAAADVLISILRINGSKECDG